MTTQTQIHVNVLAFGQIVDIIGKSAFNYSTTNTLSDFKTKLENEYPQLTKISFRIAINKKIALDQKDLFEGDELALLPPFSGG